MTNQNTARQAIIISAESAQKILWALESTAIEDNRPMLMCAYTQLKNGTLTVAGMDGDRLAVVHVPVIQYSPDKYIGGVRNESGEWVNVFAKDVYPVRYPDCNFTPFEYDQRIIRVGDRTNQKKRGLRVELYLALKNALAPIKVEGRNGKNKNIYPEQVVLAWDVDNVAQMTVFGSFNPSKQAPTPVTTDPVLSNRKFVDWRKIINTDNYRFKTRMHFDLAGYQYKPKEWKTALGIIANNGDSGRVVFVPQINDDSDHELTLEMESKTGHEYGYRTGIQVHSSNQHFDFGFNAALFRDAIAGFDGARCLYGSAETAFKDWVLEPAPMFITNTENIEDADQIAVIMPMIVGH